MMFELWWCHVKRSADVEISTMTCVFVTRPQPYTYWSRRWTMLASLTSDRGADVRADRCWCWCRDDHWRQFTFSLVIARLINAAAAAAAASSHVTDTDTKWWPDTGQRRCRLDHQRRLFDGCQQEHDVAWHWRRLVIITRSSATAEGPRDASYGRHKGFENQKWPPRSFKGIGNGAIR